MRRDRPQRRISTSRLLLIAILLTLGLRTVVIATKPCPTGDENSYIGIAESLAEGRGFRIRHAPAYYPPLYPSSVFLVGAVTGDAFLATRILFVLGGPLLVFAVYSLTRRLYSRRIGALAGLLAAVFPSLVGMGAYWGQSETFYVSFAVLGLASWIRGTREEGNLSFLAAGGWLALALLTRTEGLVLVLALLTAAVFRPRRWPKTAALILVPVLLAVGARCLVNLHVADRFTPDLRLAGFLKGGFRSNTGDMKAAVESGAIGREPGAGKDLVRKGFAAKLDRNAGDLARDASYVFPPFLLVPVCLGLFGGPLRRRRRHGHLLVLAVVCATAGFVMAAFVKASYVALLAPALIPWTALGLLRLDRWIVRTWRGLPPRLGTGVALVLLTALIAVQPLRLAAGGRLPGEYYRAELWIREAAPAGTLVLTDSANSGIHTGLVCRGVGNWRLARVRERARLAPGPVLLMVGERAWKYSPVLTREVRRALETGELRALRTFECGGRRLWVIPLAGCDGVDWGGDR